MGIRPLSQELVMRWQCIGWTKEKGSHLISIGSPIEETPKSQVVRFHTEECLRSSDTCELNSCLYEDSIDAVHPF